MEIRLIFLNQKMSDGVYFSVSSYWIEDAAESLPGNSLFIDCTKTDTGRWVEHTKALERTTLKELGKMHP
jgi:hypothetical protein